MVIALVLAQQFAPGSRSAARRGNPPSSLALAAVLFTAVGIHMGFLQVGVGLLTMVALTRVHSPDLVTVNAAKMAIVLVTSIASTACFAAAGEIAWAPALWLAAGAGVGSFLAGSWSVRRGHGAVRIVVLIVCGVAMVRLGFQLAS